jgi:glyoxylase-like metal-dependent hydrolase (beta-lactamase superfamily II)
MKQLLANIWEWSWFSEEKQLDFNGHVLRVGEHMILVDPPLLSTDDLVHIKRQGAVDYILLTNRDHLRESVRYQQEFQCQLWVPVADAGEIDAKANHTYKDGELLPGGIWAVQLDSQKSPGESALFIQQGKGILIVGDALIGKPAGSVCMLPDERYADAVKAKDGLRRLHKYQFDTLLVGDGASILTGAKNVVTHFLSS